MQLSEIRTRLQDIYGNTLGSNDDYYNRVINDAYHKLCAMGDWWFLEKDWVLTVNTPVTSYTPVTATLGSPTVVPSAGISFATVYGILDWVKAADRTYQINAAVTATALILDSNWLDATNTAATISVWGDIFTLPTDCAYVRQVSCRGDPNHKPLQQVNLGDIEAYGPDVSDYGYEFGNRYAVFRDPDQNSTASQVLKLRIFPPPDETTEYLVRYRIEPQDLSADTDVPFIPPQYHQCLVDAARLELLKIEGEDADRIQAWEQELARSVRRLFNEQAKRGKILRRFGRRGYVSDAPAVRFKMKNVEGVEW